MARVYALANQKGGVGKTTTAVNLAASLAAAERRVLLVDVDPQGNASSGLGWPRARVERHLYEALAGEVPADQLVVPTDLPTLSLIASHRDLAGADLDLADAPGREGRLARALAPLLPRFDHVFLDCPPALGLLTVNALCAADAVLVPMQCEYYALEGLSELTGTIERVRAGLNPRLELAGILLCMVDARLSLTTQVEREVRRHFDGKVFETTVPRNVRLGEAPSFGKPVLLYDLDSRGCQSYLQLARELLAREARA